MNRLWTVVAVAGMLALVLFVALMMMTGITLPQLGAVGITLFVAIALFTLVACGAALTEPDAWREDYVSAAHPLRDPVIGRDQVLPAERDWTSRKPIWRDR